MCTATWRVGWLATLRSATWLGVALVEEGLGLRAAGIDAPILVLSECPPGSEVAAVAASLTPTVCSSDGLDRLAAAASSVRPTVGVHVKVDTGMHRVGLWPPEGAAGFVDRVVATGLELDGLWTHLACADTDEMTTRRQLGLFAEVLERGVRRATGPGSCTPTPPARSGSRALGSISCVRASVSTASSRPRASATISTCGPR